LGLIFRVEPFSFADPKFGIWLTNKTKCTYLGCYLTKGTKINALKRKWFWMGPRDLGKRIMDCELIYHTTKNKFSGKYRLAPRWL
jgi:hypothetical protein